MDVGFQKTNKSGLCLVSQGQQEDMYTFVWHNNQDLCKQVNNSACRIFNEKINSHSVKSDFLFLGI